MKNKIPIFSVDEDGYPTESTLRRITKWDYTLGFANLLEGIRLIWAYADCGYWKKYRNKYWISTAGWSGNESIMSSLQKNRMFWGCSWVSSRVGGHYKFKLRKEEVK